MTERFHAVTLVVEHAIHRLRVHGVAFPVGSFVALGVEAQDAQVYLQGVGPR